MGISEDLFNSAMQLVTSSSLTMVMVNAIKLNILEAIAEAGQNAHLSAWEITSRLSIMNPDAPETIDRMLRLLASHSVVTCTQELDDKSKPVRAYGLAPIAKYFVRNDDGVSLGPLMELAHDKVFFDSWFMLKDYVLEGGIPIDKFHGANTFEYASINAKFNMLFNDAMLNHSTIVMKEILKGYHGFDTLRRVVDVGGGLGVNLNMIITKYPLIKGTNYDLPHVIRNAPLYHGIEHVEGDMFHDVPKGDAIILKLILHDWNDYHCIKLLKNCYKALPDDGKVIVVDAILSFLPDTSISDQVNTNMDVIMMTNEPRGKERTEVEFLTLAKGVGFNVVKKVCFVCNYWVMEFYK